MQVRRSRENGFDRSVDITSGSPGGTRSNVFSLRTKRMAIREKFVESVGQTLAVAKVNPLGVSLDVFDGDYFAGSFRSPLPVCVFRTPEKRHEFI